MSANRITVNQGLALAHVNARARQMQIALIPANTVCWIRVVGIPVIRPAMIGAVWNLNVGG